MRYSKSWAVDMSLYSSELCKLSTTGYSCASGVVHSESELQTSMGSHADPRAVKLCEYRGRPRRVAVQEWDGAAGCSYMLQSRGLLVVKVPSNLTRQPVSEVALVVTGTSLLFPVSQHRVPACFTSVGGYFYISWKFII